MQERRNSIDIALELSLSSTNPSNFNDVIKQASCQMILWYKNMWASDATVYSGMLL